MHVLMVEDDALLGDGVQAGLQAHGFSVAWVTRAADADAALDSTAFDLVVLDLGLPDQDGLSLLARWRRLGRDEPVLVLTARDGVEHRVAGLNAGADALILFANGTGQTDVHTLVQAGNIVFIWRFEYRFDLVQRYTVFTGYRCLIQMLDTLLSDD